MILQRLRRNRRMPLEQRLFENKDRHWIFVAGLALVGLIAINQLIRLTHPDLSPLEGWVSALAAVSAIVVLAPSRALGGSSAVIALTVLALYVLGIWVWPQPRDDATVVIQLLFLGGVLALAHVVAVGRSKRTAHGMRDEEQARWLLTLRQAERASTTRLREVDGMSGRSVSSCSCGPRAPRDRGRRRQIYGWSNRCSPTSAGSISVSAWTPLIDWR